MDNVVGDELTFPNPFGNTLCVPHYVFLPMRLIIQGLIYAAYIAFLVWKNSYKRLLAKRSDLITWQNEESVRRKNNTKSTSNSAKQKEFQALYDQSESEIKNQVNSILSDYIDSDEVINDLIIDSIEWHESSFLVMKRAINTQMTRYNNRYVLGNNLEWAWFIWTITIHVGMLAAILYKFSLAFFYSNQDDSNEKVRSFGNASNWQIYQGLFTVMFMYLPGLPLSNIIWLFVYYNLSDLIIRPNNWINERFPQLRLMINRSTFYKSNPLFGWNLWFKFVFVFTLLIPWIFTHMIPSYFMFGPLICVCLFITFIVIFFSDSIWNKDEGWDAGFIGLCVVVFEICIQMTSIACIIFYSGQGWITGFTSSLFGYYCSNQEYPSNWITFNPSKFDWPELVILVGWVFN